MPAAGNSFYVKRTVRLIAECVADLLDGKVHRLIEIDERAVRPQFAANLVAGHKRAALANKQKQQLEWLRLQFQPAVFASKFAGIDVEFEFTKTENFPSCTHGLSGARGRPVLGPQAYYALETAFMNGHN